MMSDLWSVRSILVSALGCLWALSVLAEQRPDPPGSLEHAFSECRASITRITPDAGCAVIVVTENRASKAPRLLDIHVARLPSHSPGRLPPILYLSGGPGERIEMHLEKLKDHPIRQRRDLIIVEQRGSGASGDFCPDLGSSIPLASPVPERQAFDRLKFELVRQCFEAATAADVDLSAYSTLENAQDLRDIRTVLQIATWDVWGVSYGTKLAQAYAKIDEPAIRSVVLDSVVELHPRPALLRVARNYDRALSQLALACRTSKTCSKAFLDLQTELRRSIAALGENPLAISTDVADQPNWIHADVLGAAPFFLMYDERNFSSVPAFIRAMQNAIKDRRDLPILSAVENPLGQMSLGMFHALMCRDGLVHHAENALTLDHKDYPILVRAVDGILTSPIHLSKDHIALCEQYVGDPIDPAQMNPLSSSLPVLVIAGEMDPVTPPEFAVAVASTLPNATVFRLPYSGHGSSLMSNCPISAMLEFLDEPERPLENHCALHQPPPAFIGPIFETSLLSKATFVVSARPVTAGVLGVILLASILAIFWLPIRRVMCSSAACTRSRGNHVAKLSLFAAAVTLAGLGGPVTLSCRSDCSLMQPLLRRPRGFSSRVLNASVADCRSH